MKSMAACRATGPAVNPCFFRNMCGHRSLGLEWPRTVLTVRLWPVPGYTLPHRLMRLPEFMEIPVRQRPVGVGAIRVSSAINGFTSQ